MYANKLAIDIQRSCTKASTITPAANVSDTLDTSVRSILERAVDLTKLIVRDVTAIPIDVLTWPNASGINWPIASSRTCAGLLPDWDQIGFHLGLQSAALDGLNFSRSHTNCFYKRQPVGPVQMSVRWPGGNVILTSSHLCMMYTMLQHSTDTHPLAMTCARLYHSLKRRERLKAYTRSCSEHTSRPPAHSSMLLSSRD